MKSFLFMVPTFSWYDAVGNDTVGMANSLCGDRRPPVFAECGERDDLPRVSVEEIIRLTQIRQNVLVYQHCVDWPKGEEVLSQAKCRIVMRYQNITPYSFFKKYNEGATNQCRRGTEQTKRLWKSLIGALWLPNSQYTSTTLPVDFSNGASVKVLAPYVPLSQVKSGSSDSLRRKRRPRNSAKKEDETLRLLFVGRQAPNKGHAFLLEALYRYTTVYGRKIRLCFVGRLPAPFVSYREELMRRVSFRELHENVVFDETANNEQLLEHYHKADYFVCASEHEGFGVPLVEAQRERLPVLAVSEDSVAETLGPGQILLPRDPDCFAAAIRTLEKNPTYKQYLIQQGLRNSERFAPTVFSRTLRSYVDAWLKQTEASR